MSREQELEDVKTTLRSLLLSVTHGLTIREVLRDYKEYEGVDLPYRKLGFSSADGLFAAIPDTVRSRFSCGETILTAVSNESTDHIQKLVSRQRVAVKKRPAKRGRVLSLSSFHTSRAPHRNYQPPPRFTHGTAAAAPPMQRKMVPDLDSFRRIQEHFMTKQKMSDGLAKYIIDLVDKHPEGLELKKFNFLFCEAYGYLLDPTQQGFRTVEDMLFSISDCIKIVNTGRCMMVYSKPRDLGNLTTAFRGNSVDAGKQATGFRSTAAHATTISREQAPASSVSGVAASNHINNFLPNSDRSLSLQPQSEKPLLPNPILPNGSSQTLSSSKRLCHSSNERSETLQRSLPAQSALSMGSTNVKSSDLHRVVSSLPLKHTATPDPISKTKKHFYADDEIFRNKDPMHARMKENLKKVLQKNPNGISCLKLPSAFKEVTNLDLKLNELGFTNVMELVSSYPDVFATYRETPTSPWMLYDANCETPYPNVSYEAAPPCIDLTTDVPEWFKKKLVQVIKAHPCGILIDCFSEKYKATHNEHLPYKAFGYDSVHMLLTDLVGDIVSIQHKNSNAAVVNLLPDALDRFCSSSPIMFKERPRSFKLPPRMKSKKIPDDAVMLGCCLPVVDVNVEDKTFFSVLISQWLDPTCFYMQVVGENTTTALELVMERLEEDYNGQAGENYCVHREHLVEGFLCAVLYAGDNNWHRGRVLSAVAEKIKIFYVDYGTECVVTIDAIRYLKKSYLDFSCQAIRCRLASIMPQDGSKTWSAKATNRFAELAVKGINPGDLNAMIVNRRTHPVTKEVQYFVCLCAHGKDHINDMLVEEGLASFHTNDCPKAEAERPWNANMRQLGMPPFMLPPGGQELLSQFYMSGLNPPAYGGLFPTPPMMNPFNFMGGLNYSPNMFGAIPMTNLPTWTPWGMPPKNAAKDVGSQPQPQPQPPPPPPPRVNSETGVNNRTSSVEPVPAVNNRTSSVEPVPADRGQSHKCSPNDANNVSSTTDELVERLCHKFDSVLLGGKRCIKLVQLTPARKGHFIRHNKELYMISQEISALFWKRDYLVQMLRVHELKIGSVVVSEEVAPELTAELVRNNLCTSVDGKYIARLYSLDDVLRMIPKFKSNDKELSEAIRREIVNFTDWEVGADELSVSSDNTAPDSLDLGFQMFSKRKEQIKRQLTEENNIYLQQELNLINERLKFCVFNM